MIGAILGYVPFVEPISLFQTWWYLLLIPLALGWLLLLATIRVGNDRDWNYLAVVGVCIAVFILGASLLSTALSTARRERLAEEVH